MSQFPLTPDQIKTIAAELRSTEAARLGTKLPNTSALNAITRALGMGPDFRSFKASFEAQSVPLEAQIKTTDLMIVFEWHDYEEGISDADGFARIEQIIKEAGFRGGFEQPAHRFLRLYINAAGDQSGNGAVARLEQDLQAEIAKLIEDSELPEIKARMQWTTSTTDRELIANFYYHDNGQVCSGSLNEGDWAQRKQLGLTDEECFLLLCGEVEIFEGYDASDIDLQDIMIQCEFYCDA